MKILFFLSSLFIATMFTTCAQQDAITGLAALPSLITDPTAYNELNAEEAWVILRQGTERPFTGAYHDSKEIGVYICKQCNNPLFRSSDKFNSGTGWPSFDDEIGEAVKEVPDADGRRTEIVCANCDGHLGHVFYGEGFTEKQTRHCANSLSLNFVPAENIVKKPTSDIERISDYIKGKGYEKYEAAIFAGGCFWCTEASFDRIKGVKDVISGYSGGTSEYPTYEQVGGGRTDHAEAVIVFYDPAEIDYKTLLQVFFVAHDPTQLNRQGPDVGKQYRSAIFYKNEAQKLLAEATILQLDEEKIFPRPIVTEIKAYDEFWVAEPYHQDYYMYHPDQSYIRNVSKPKVEKVEKIFADILKDEFRK